MHMESVPNYPPYSSLIKVFESCPEVIFTYLKLWKERTGNTFLVEKREHIQFDHFREEISKLRAINLLDYTEDMFTFRLTLAAPYRHTAGHS
jgi:hypothetical protein